MNSGPRTRRIARLAAPRVASLMVEPDGLLKRAQRHPDFYAAVILLAALSLWPVWSVRFLPMQDYPQHLFIAYVTATFEDQSLAWGRFYQANLAVKPYMLTYLIERFLASFLDIEVAGKLVVSSFIILTSVLVVKNAAKCDGQNVPWGLLILFPLIFNQIYYLGFQSYLLSLPILFLALMDLDSFVSRPLSTRSVIQHLIYQALLLLSHPYSALVYLGLAGASLPFYWRSRDAFRRAVMAPLFLGFVFGAWYLGLPGPDAANPASVWGMRWWSLLQTLSYFFLMFQGMGSIAEGWPAEFLLWIFIWALIGFAIIHRRGPIRIPPKARLFILLSLVMYVALPFWLGQYSYFNVRLAPVAYGFLALALAYVPVHRIVGYLCVAALIGLLLLTGRTHDRLSAETETILPILAKMERGATVLPIYFDASTQYLHRQAFYQFHSHDHYYYHLLVGGGANPTLFPNPMIPLQYKPGIFLPGLSEVSRVGWDQVLSAYRYVLIRNSSPDFVRSIDRHVKPVIRSGPWLLLEVQRNGDG